MSTTPAVNRGLSALRAGVAMGTDPQFTAPVRPRLLPDLVTIPFEGGLIIDGTAELQVLRGRATRELLPRLLPLLDGTRTSETLALETGWSHGNMRAAIALLYACGILEDAECDDGLPTDMHAAPEVANVLARHLDTTRVNRNASEAITGLGTASVLVAADGEVGTNLVDLLRAAGVSRASLSPIGDVPGSALGACDLLVVLEGPGVSSRDLSRLDRWCAHRQVPWLRSTCGAGVVEIGPRFEDGVTACHDCFHHEWGSSPDRNPAYDKAWLGLLTDEVIRLTSRVGRSVSTEGVHLVNLTSWTTRTVLVSRRPGCPHCCPNTGSGEPSLAYRYEQAVAFPPRHLLNPKDHQQHYRPGNLSLQSDQKHYRGAPHVLLEPLDRLPRPTGTYLDRLLDRGTPAAATLDQHVLGGLLLRVGGRRPGAAQPHPNQSPPRTPTKVQRWLPSGGNLGSVGLYVLAVGVPGLVPGWYFYEADSHSLAMVRDRSRTARADPPDGDDRGAAAGRLASQVAPSAHGADALIVMTGALARVAHKYSDFAYRVIHLDAGAATAQLQAVADGYGLHTKVVATWDDPLVRDELDLDSVAEPVTTVISLHGRTSHATRF